jgi:hypothetical protein
VTTAALDRLLALLISALVTTGLVTLKLGAANEAWVFVVHGVLAGALAVTVAMKLGRSLPKAIRARRWGRVAFGLLLSAATIGALVAGFAWVASGRLLTIASWTVLTLHAWIGLVLVPITIVHLLPRRWRLLRVPRRRPSTVARVGITRRQLLTGGVVGGASLVVFGAAQLADSLAGGVRRFTGSRWLPGGGLPPDTTFFGEAAPTIDAVTWRVRVHRGAETGTTLSMPQLASLGLEDRLAALDCPSGWALTTTWHGVPLPVVLEAAGIDAGTGPVVIRSATGWSTTLSPDEAGRALLAVGVAGVPLPAANGAPCRLVVPDRRGLDWVKWVTEIEAA